ncbi:MAG: HAD family phosphatase [Defluviitaleaceae bacterium]|nr:HAD family phosphatase [Defluviitaleaceae bacterium]
MTIATIFDMDGVLIDSQPLHYEIDIQVLQSCGYPATLADVTPFTGMSNPDRWPKYKEKFNLTPTAAELITAAEKTMREIFNKTDLTPIEGIPQLLQSLNDLGIPTGVASSSSHELIEMVLSRIGITHHFNKIVSGEDVKHGKPAPDIYLKAATQISLPPSQCIAIEDAPAGILSAKNAGFTTIAYKNPNTHGQIFTHADYVIDRYCECLEIIKTVRNNAGHTA